MKFIVGASSAGTIIEWYDFYLYGALTFVLAPIFTPVSNDP
ncbi:MAG: MHS family MFS transporter, partial [Methanobacteriota archaeon]